MALLGGESRCIHLRSCPLTCFEAVLMIFHPLEMLVRQRGSRSQQQETASGPYIKSHKPLFVTLPVGCLPSMGSSYSERHNLHKERQLPTAVLGSQSLGGSTQTKDGMVFVREPNSLLHDWLTCKSEDCLNKGRGDLSYKDVCFVSRVNSIIQYHFSGALHPSLLWPRAKLLGQHKTRQQSNQPKLC